MATLVIGPFYLAGTLSLDPMGTGLVMTVGPAVAAATGVPAGWLVDRLGASPVALAGLTGIVLASGLMSVLPAVAGVGGYVCGLALVTMSYALFQAANTTAVISRSIADRRGVISALLALARNLGLVTGASAMGAVYAFGSRTSNMMGVAAGGHAGLRLTFVVAAALGTLALAATLWATLPRSGKRRTDTEVAPLDALGKVQVGQAARTR